MDNYLWQLRLRRLHPAPCHGHARVSINGYGMPWPTLMAPTATAVVHAFRYGYTTTFLDSDSAQGRFFPINSQIYYNQVKDKI